MVLARWVLARLVNPLSVGLSFWFGRFDTWLSSRLKLPPSYLLSYSGNYTDDAQSWRLVDITRLTTKYQNDQADKRICTSLLKTKTCSLERALRRTHRFQKWLRAKRLTPDLVQVSAPPPAPKPEQGSPRAPAWPKGDSQSVLCCRWDNAGPGKGLGLSPRRARVGLLEAEGECPNTLMPAGPQAGKKINKIKEPRGVKTPAAQVGMFLPHPQFFHPNVSLLSVLYVRLPYS